MNRNFLRQVLEKDLVVVPNPGFHFLCKGCENEGNCPETSEVLRTIQYEGQTIGVIILITYTQPMIISFDKYEQ